MPTKATKGKKSPVEVIAERLDSDEFVTDAPSTEAVEILSIPRPRIFVLTQAIRGTGPYVQARFSEKARKMMADKMEAGSTATKNKNRVARDFDDDFRQSMHAGPNGEHGMPAAAFRAAAISACRIVGFKMTQAKLGFFVEQDFLDTRDGTPLVQIFGKSKPVRLPVRNATGVADLRVRAMFEEWDATLRIRFDGDMFTRSDILNLLARVGIQVGIGEGRPDSKKSAGMGWGTFKLVGSPECRELTNEEMGIE